MGNRYVCTFCSNVTELPAAICPVCGAANKYEPIKYGNSNNPESESVSNTASFSNMDESLPVFTDMIEAKPYKYESSKEYQANIGKEQEKPIKKTEVKKTEGQDRKRINFLKSLWNPAIVFVIIASIILILCLVADHYYVLSASTIRNIHYSGHDVQYRNKKTGEMETYIVNPQYFEEHVDRIIEEAYSPNGRVWIFGHNFLKTSKIVFAIVLLIYFICIAVSYHHTTPEYAETQARKERARINSRIYAYKMEKRIIEEEKEDAEYRIRTNPLAAKYYAYPCPHCGHYKVRNMTWDDKRWSVAFWGMWSSEIGKHYVCDKCGKEWS